MGTDIKVGDRVKVSLEGEVNRVLEYGDGEQELRISVDGRDNYVYTDTALVEKVEPEYETFGPGDVVRRMGSYRALGAEGYVLLSDGRYFRYDNPDSGAYSLDEFTSRDFERVVLP